jgi:uncharacterized SAM-binding protein YcdF (DUF218 family)
MFFLSSKILGFFTVPSNLILLLAVAGLLLTATRFKRAGQRVAVGAVLLLAVAGLSPLGNALILPLEQRFPSRIGMTEAPDGIVVLGGAIGPVLSHARGQAALNESAERVIVIAELARRFPQARIVYSGGNPSLFDRGPGEATFALPLFESFGIARSRIEVEDKSLNTDENAVLTKALVQPKPGERWLLVTSAHHMPRAVGCFRRAGFEVVAYPVDWRTHGAVDLMSPFATVAAGLARTDVAVKEWVGLAAYRLTGKTSELFPGPN